MKCPHCNYEYTKVENYYDNFFELDVQMVQSGYSYDHGYIETNEKSLFGCPKCDKVFMDYGHNRNETGEQE